MTNDARNAADLKRKNAKTASAQDIINSPLFENIVAGPEDMGRRLAAQSSLKTFIETYAKETCYLAWSPAHLRALDLLQDSILNNRRFCLAMPRGSGKSSLCGLATIWALVCGHSQYTVSIGATSKSSKIRLDSIKTSLRFNRLLARDYPEICIPIEFCGGESRRAVGQKCNGVPTEILWAQNQIKTATLDIDPFSWQLDNNLSPAYGCVIDTASIDSEIRGKAFERPDGTMQRPTFVIADDVQTRESAKNPETVTHREQIIKSDVMYLGGPATQIGIALPITVIYQDDLADRLLNHDLNPEMRGERTKMMVSMPADGVEDDDQKDEIDKLWESYDEIRRADHLAGTNFCTNFYVENHDEMTVGAEAAWPERFNAEKGEVDAIQHAMNLKLEDERAFFSECQNEPMALDISDLPPLKAIEVAERRMPLKRFIAPSDADFLTSFIDISRNVLWYTTVAYKSSDFTATVIDYGSWPQQNAAHFTLNTVRKTIPDVYKEHGEYTSCLHAALNDCVHAIASREYYTEAGNIIDLKNIGIDSGWGQHSVDVYRNCKRSAYKSIVVPTKGFGITPLKKPLVDPEKKQEPKTDIIGQWRFTPTLLRNWLLTYDTNQWKSKVNQSFRVPVGNRGSTSFFDKRTNNKKADHRMIAEQSCAEISTWLESGTRKVETWKTKIEGSDNHFLDCLVGCHVLAHVNGAKLPAPKAINGADIVQAPRRRRRYRKS